MVWLVFRITSFCRKASQEGIQTSCCLTSPQCTSQSAYWKQHRQVASALQNSEAKSGSMLYFSSAQTCTPFCCSAVVEDNITNQQAWQHGRLLVVGSEHYIIDHNPPIVDKVCNCAELLATFECADILFVAYATDIICAAVVQVEIPCMPMMGIPICPLSAVRTPSLDPLGPCMHSKTMQHTLFMCCQCRLLVQSLPHCWTYMCMHNTRTLCNILHSHAVARFARPH